MKGDNEDSHFKQKNKRVYARKHSQALEDDVGCDWLMLMGREAAANKSVSIPYKRRRNINIGVAL